MPTREDAYTLALQQRIKTLENELLRRPTIGELEYVRERIGRQEALYRAALARNVVLRRRLGELVAAQKWAA